MGHVVSKDGVLVDPNNIAKILAWQTPTTVTERQILGLGSYYRRFIHEHAFEMWSVSEASNRNG